MTTSNVNWPDLQISVRSQYIIHYCVLMLCYIAHIYNIYIYAYNSRVFANACVFHTVFRSSIILAINRHSEPLSNHWRAHWNQEIYHTNTSTHTPKPTYPRTHALILKHIHLNPPKKKWRTTGTIYLSLSETTSAACR